jgi:hypothetical protein
MISRYQAGVWEGNVLREVRVVGEKAKTDKLIRELRRHCLRRSLYAGAFQLALGEYATTRSHPCFVSIRCFNVIEETTELAELALNYSGAHHDPRKDAPSGR